MRSKVRSLSQGKAVVVHTGARDAYQVARALDERALLECLVTDLYWPADRPWAARLFHFRPFAGQVGIQPDVTHEALVAAYREADLFVFPSVAEGFGQVLLEELACGLPILSTTHTAAPDLIGDGLEGWIVPPARPDLLAERIAWTCTHRDELATMRSLARSRAEEFTWSRFREGIATAFSEFVARQARHV